MAPNPGLPNPSRNLPQGEPKGPMAAQGCPLGPQASQWGSLSPNPNPPEATGDPWTILVTAKANMPMMHIQNKNIMTPFAAGGQGHCTLAVRTYHGAS